MATLRPCVQKQRADGFYPVYIRVIHERQSAFIKTGKVVDKKSVTKNREIRDNAVLRYCTELIGYYNQRLNMQDTSKWTVKEVVAFLSTEETDASFSDYAKLHISRMINDGHARNAKNYSLAANAALISSSGLIASPTRSIRSGDVDSYFPLSGFRTKNGPSEFSLSMPFPYRHKPMTSQN